MQERRPVERTLGIGAHEKNSIEREEQRLRMEALRFEQLHEQHSLHVTGSSGEEC